MELSRRSFFAAAGGSILAPWATASAAWPVLTSLPFGQDPKRTSPLRSMATTATADPSYSSYSSTLVNGYTLANSVWQGKTWKCDMGSAWNPNMDYCWRATTGKLRFELHDTTHDKGLNDPITKRRSELHANKYRLPNGISMWGAYSFIDHSWSDPVGMSKLQGGSHCQMHMPSGGSPAFSFRRYKDGSFRVTTNGDNDSVNNHERYKGILSFDKMHDIVYRFVLHPTNGELDVWLDRVKILSLRGISMGSSTVGCYLCLGLYYGGGVTCPIVAEYANVVFPSTIALNGRSTLRSPAWPTA